MVNIQYYITREANELIKLYNIMKAEREFIQDKFKSKVDLIDIEAKNAFTVNYNITSFIKYMYGYNYYSVRDSLINYRRVIDKCL